ncbi:hypothetical protein TNCV_4617601 [Trichonephila clavipes]|nr:hypothetical protein TNCV_4617601 [Trichonephila clavipes]
MSLVLSDLLIAPKTDIYGGTVRTNRRDLPTEFTKRKLQKGQIIAFQRISLQKNPSRPITVDNTARLTERHFKFHIPTTLAKREPTHKTGQSLLLKKNTNGKKDTIGALNPEKEDQAATKFHKAGSLSCNILSHVEKRHSKSHEVQKVTKLLGCIEKLIRGEFLYAIENYEKSKSAYLLVRVGCGPRKEFILNIHNGLQEL